MGHHYKTKIGLLCLALSIPNTVYAEKANLSRLQAMFNTEVTSVSRKAEDPFHSAAAVYVITKKDIERAGATTIAEALRLAPGLHVAQAGSNWWSISARGFTDNIANKLLVLIDGRTVYNTLFSGTWWDSQHVFMEDIKHIEIIHGPGATMWGANAVNGIINIITEDAVNTLDNYASVTMGNNERGYHVRMGRSLNDNTHYRIYGQFSGWDSLNNESGDSVRDGWKIGQVGFRLDSEYSDESSFTIQGDAYNEDVDRTATLPILTPPFSQSVEDNSNLIGANLLARWKHNLSNDSSLQMQGYLDHVERNFSVSEEIRTTLDLDFQHMINTSQDNELTWGAGYRVVRDWQPFRFYFPYNPQKRWDSLYSLFIQNKTSFLDDTLDYTIGSKFEHNIYSGFEYQPSTRLSWHPNNNQTLWGAISRAIRSPSRFENDGNQIVGVIPPQGGFVRFEPNRDVESEELMAYELGYRYRHTKDFSVDVAAFYNEYDNLRTFEALAPFSTSPTTALPLRIDNQGEASSFGVEISNEWNVFPIWQLSSAYSFLVMDTDTDEGSTDTSLATDEGKAPKHQFNLRSRLKLPHQVELNNTLYYVDHLPTINIDDYIRFDARVSWKPASHVEVSVNGNNLFDSGHQEFTAIPVLQNAEIGRSFYVKLSIIF